MAKVDCASSLSIACLSAPLSLIMLLQYNPYSFKILYQTVHSICKWWFQANYGLNLLLGVDLLLMRIHDTKKLCLPGTFLVQCPKLVGKPRAQTSPQKTTKNFHPGIELKDHKWKPSSKQSYNSGQFNSTFRFIYFLQTNY